MKVVITILTPSDLKGLDLARHLIANIGVASHPCAPQTRYDLGFINSVEYKIHLIG